MNSVVNLIETPFISRPIAEKIEIKALGKPTPDLANLNQTVTSGKRTFNRKFNKSVYSKCSWLCGCDTKPALYCFPCLLFGGEGTWTKAGFKDINHLSDRIKKHEASATHIQNSLKLALLGSSNVAEQSDSAYRRNIAAHNEQVKQNRHILNIIINCIRFCGVFEIALRGHDETDDSTNPGIFRGMIDYTAELDSALKSHLAKATVFKGTSKRIQNELLQIMLEAVSYTHLDVYKRQVIECIAIFLNTFF